ncbi:MAG: alpha/beta fold hydrolase [Microthrixaceae bacterium]
MTHDPTNERDTGPAPLRGAPAPMVMLHGFTQNHRCLGPLRDEVALRRPVINPDLPGHGSSADAAALSIVETADLLVGRTGATEASMHWFGYSMGGRVALRLALDHPEAVRSLVLLAATAGISDAAERSERALLDDERAQRVESVGVEQFCSEWLDAPMFAALPDWARFTSERHANTAVGLAGSLRNAGTGSMEPLWDRLPSLEAEVLLLSGALDQKFTEVATDMAEAIGPNARVTTIDGAGHAAHLEAPEATARVVLDFLSALDGA